MGSPPISIKEKLKLKMLELRIKHIDGAVCTSEECARQISYVTDGRILGIPEHPQITPRYEIKIPKSPRNLLFLGRVEASRGIYMLLEAFVAIKRDFPDLKLVFAGSGSQDENLERAINGAGLSDIRFVGGLNSTEVHEQISNSDLLICPTTTGFNEGLALVGFEAAAHGVPTILSSVVPAADLLHGCSLAFRADSTEDLTRTMREIISNDTLYAKLCHETKEVRSGLYNRGLSWGSQLAKVLLSA
ncbi:MAG: glycosyltransferase family 4 protein [Pseudomonadota bacterium]